MLGEMAVAALSQLNVEEPPPAWGSCSVDSFEKLEQIGEGTYCKAKEKFRERRIWSENFVELEYGDSRVISFWVIDILSLGFMFLFCRQVFMAREIKTGEIVALKKIRMDNEKEGPSSPETNLNSLVNQPGNFSLSEPTSDLVFIFYNTTPSCGGDTPKK
ncbi:hypothetical protein Patl1_27212 [Pistacia atlantica]|uniref:Uncharacterized protein n=1 Tax=Pistacia atlantica TaxID=434234 RepID=A0ACC1BE82_9ROSI|nr:hypothetical protein Patl1_27212 [Pistacia atlantica]